MSSELLFRIYLLGRPPTNFLFFFRQLYINSCKAHIPRGCRKQLNTNTTKQNAWHACHQRQQLYRHFGGWVGQAATEENVYASFDADPTNEATYFFTVNQEFYAVARTNEDFSCAW